ncbi:MAG TPA: dihydrofolate reductase [Crocinitomicaceae bacterium]|nr:dihydrofolate reductase [Crocinitomicaceae bacterium]
MKIAVIVAKDQQNGIGKNNDLPWHLPADMKFFKETTTGHIVLMGRKNFESIPEKFRPLHNRLNVVVTRNKDFQAPNCLVFHSIDEVIAWKNTRKNDNRTLFVIGGGELFQQFLTTDLVEEMYITHIHTTVDADIFFPEINENNWSKEIILNHTKDEKNAFDFTIWKYFRN